MDMRGGLNGEGVAERLDKWGSFFPNCIEGGMLLPAPLNDSNEFANLGDWFWDDFTVNGTTITGWDALWDRDIPCIQRSQPNSIQANSIRVYSM
jgi:hypothetical protein